MNNNYASLVRASAAHLFFNDSDIDEHVFCGVVQLPKFELPEEFAYKKIAAVKIELPDNQNECIAVIARNGFSLEKNIETKNILVRVNGENHIISKGSYDGSKMDFLGVALMFSGN